VEDPDGGEGTNPGGWFPAAGSADRDGWAEVEQDEALRADALLLGRRSYEWFATRWGSRVGAWADRLRAVPKYVVSSTMPEDRAEWGPTTIVSDLVTQVKEIRGVHDGDIVVYASHQLVGALLSHDLVDEIRLFVHPVVLGPGRRLFGAADHPVSLRLAEARTVGQHLALLTYETIRDEDSSGMR
jgi:dihydrofolate reductase